jgi:hypothetical protein
MCGFLAVGPTANSVTTKSASRYGWEAAELFSSELRAAVEPLRW